MPTKTPPSRTGKHQGPEGRTIPRIAPEKSLTSLLKPIENDDWSYFCLLLLKRCCSPTTKSLTSLLKPIENDDFNYFCLLLLKRCCSPTKTPPSRTGKHHGPEGRTSPRIAPKNSLTSLLKPIEKDNKRIIWATFVVCCWRGAAVPTKTPPSRTGKHQGPAGRTSPRSAPKNSLTSHLKPIENDLMMMIFATFVFCC